MEKTFSTLIGSLFHSFEGARPREEDLLILSFFSYLRFIEILNKIPFLLILAPSKRFKIHRLGNEMVEEGGSSISIKMEISIQATLLRIENLVDGSCFDAGDSSLDSDPAFQKFLMIAFFPPGKG